MTAAEAQDLLARHGFTDLRHWEDRFAEHPYAHQAVGACPFFVVTACRPGA